MKSKLRKWNVLLGTCILCFLLAGSAGNVHAMAYSTSTSIIDWSSLLITHGTGGSFTVSQIDGYDWYETYNSESYAGNMMMTGRTQMLVSVSQMHRHMDGQQQVY